MKNKTILTLELISTIIVFAAALCSCESNTASVSSAAISSKSETVSVANPKSSSETPAVSSGAAPTASEAPAASAETSESSNKSAGSEQPVESLEVVEPDTSDTEADDSVEEQSIPEDVETKTAEQQPNETETPPSSIPQPKYGPVDKNGFVYDETNGMYYEVDENGNRTGDYYNPDVYDPDNPTWGNPGSLYEKYVQEGQNPGHIILDPDDFPDGEVDLNKLFGSPK